MQADTITSIPQTLTEIQITYSNTIPKDKRIQIQGSNDAERVLRLLWSDGTIEYKEKFYVLYLSRNNDILGYHLHSIGGIAGTVVDTKQILGIALKANASSILLSHCHPSGNLKPSTADIDLTKKIVNGAALLDVSVLDHIILTKESHYSFADDGIMPVSDNSKSYVR